MTRTKRPQRRKTPQLSAEQAQAFKTYSEPCSDKGEKSSWKGDPPMPSDSARPLGQRAKGTPLTTRLCLRCDKAFASEGAHNRLCHACREALTKDPTTETNYSTTTVRGTARRWREQVMPPA